MFLDFSGTIFKSLFLLLSIIVVINIDVDVDVIGSLWISGCTSSSSRTATVEKAAESGCVTLAPAKEAEDEAKDENSCAYPAERGNVEAKAVADQADLVFLTGQLSRSSSFGLCSLPLCLLQLTLKCFLRFQYLLKIKIRIRRTAKKPEDENM